MPRRLEMRDAECLKPSTFASRAKAKGRPAATPPRRLVSLGTQELHMEGTGRKRRDGSREGGRTEEVEVFIDADHPRRSFRRYRSNPNVLVVPDTLDDQGSWKEPLGAIRRKPPGPLHHGPAAADEVQVLRGAGW